MKIARYPATGKVICCLAMLTARLRRFMAWFFDIRPNKPFAINSALTSRWLRQIGKSSSRG